MDTQVLFDVGPLEEDGLGRIGHAQPFLTTLVLGPCLDMSEALVNAYTHTHTLSLSLSLPPSHTYR